MIATLENYHTYQHFKMEDIFQVSLNMLFSKRVLKKWLGKTTCILPKHGKDTSQTERFGRYEAFTYFKAKYLQSAEHFS